MALLVRERVLGPAHPDTAYYIRYRGAVYADLGDFNRCVALWLYALDMQQRCLEPFSPMTQSSLLSFAELFCFMMAEARPARPSRRQLAPVEFGDVLAVFERAVTELVSAGHHMPEPAEGVQRTLVIALQLAALLCRLQSQSSLEEDAFRRAAYRLVHLDLRGPRGETCLHLACGHAPPASRQALGAVCQEAFPAPPLVRLLLELGANPNATDHDRRTPLHVAAAQQTILTSFCPRPTGSWRSPRPHRRHRSHAPGLCAHACGL
ncbi:hypothetical protein HPB52_014427 [Rhipicephalus sanguineus]|uniref:Uncharacterized protein n=1 Tax=Rhipicephalus sanguineus TaxID=34632 RepID=A0A9D4T0H1_RHISA|nr:hypothetical protein HPB52_014427 [Rhipicephalus sanguineus]